MSDAVKPDELVMKIMRRAETALTLRIEERLHEMGRELSQPFDVTKDFVARIFQGMPDHVQPGHVEPYAVSYVPEVVIPQKLHPEKVNPDGTIEVDLTRTVLPTRDVGGPPDITR